MADVMFRDYLVNRAETLKNELTDPNLGVENVLAKAQEILKLEKRVHHMDNPISRKKKVVEPTA
jgi:hypothetical protein